MKYSRYRPNIGSLDSILKSDAVADVVRDVAEKIAERARAAAPVDSGSYRDSIRVVMDQHPTRVVAHVAATVPYAARLEARSAPLRRSLG